MSVAAGGALAAALALLSAGAAGAGTGPIDVVHLEVYLTWSAPSWSPAAGGR